MLITLCGDDDQRVSARLQQLLRGHLPDDAVELNLVQLDGAAIGVDELRAACDAMPFFGGKRVVVVRSMLGSVASKADGEPDGAADPADKSSGSTLIRALREYLPLVPDSTVLIFVERRKLGKTGADKVLRDLTQVEDLNLPGPNDLPAYIHQRVNELGGRIDPPASRLLTTAVAAEPKRLEPELAKLMAYRLDDLHITSRDVELLVDVPLDVKVWDLTDALFRRDARAATRGLRSLLEQGQPPQQVAGAIASQVRRLVVAEEYASAGPEALARATGTTPYVARKTLESLRSFGRGQAAKLLGELLELDRSVKTGKGEMTSALEILVLEACARRY